MTTVAQMVSRENTENRESTEAGKKGLFGSWIRTSSASVSSVSSVFKFLPCLAGIGGKCLAMCFLAAAAFSSACSVSNEGLAPAQDAAPNCGANGTPSCPAGLTNHASWPAGTCYSSCTKPCGPDGTGMRICSQTDKATCQATSGCVCLDTPCVVCADCAFRTQPLPDCYVPTNAASAPTCAQGVAQGSACGPACGRQLCLEADGKTGCLCNDQGKYACATWGETTWK